MMRWRRQLYRRFWRLKYPYRTLLIATFFGCLVILLLLGTQHQTEPQEPVATEDRRLARYLRDIQISLQFNEAEWTMFKRELTPLTYDPDMNGESIAMDDPRLVAYLRDRYLMSPSSTLLNLSHRSRDCWSALQLKETDRIRAAVGNMSGGFYVECGAYDGKTRSRTLVMERLYHWTGLLIEASSINFRQLVSKHRDAFLSNSCLSNQPYPVAVSFEHRPDGKGKVTEWPLGGQQPFHADVQCFPLLTYLLAVNRTTVDLLDLDVGGGELQVLRSIPWHRVNVRAVAVNAATAEHGRAVRFFMHLHDYLIHSETQQHPGIDIFVQGTTHNTSLEHLVVH